MTDVLTEERSAPAMRPSAILPFPSLQTQAATNGILTTPTSFSPVRATPARLPDVRFFLIESQQNVIDHCRKQLAVAELLASHRERLERVLSAAEAELSRLQPPASDLTAPEPAGAADQETVQENLQENLQENFQENFEEKFEENFQEDFQPMHDQTEAVQEVDPETIQELEAALQAAARYPVDNEADARPGALAEPTPDPAVL
jgi:hypothetical protein